MRQENDRDRCIAEMRELCVDLRRAIGRNDLDEAFRIVHSVKSMSAQLELRDIATSAHQMEERLESAREVGKLDEATAVELGRWVEKLFIAPTGSASFLASGSEESGSPDLTDFERGLLVEARRRGERYYRVGCVIDPESPLKIARAHLVVNNLEMIANVIRTRPSLDEEDDRLFGRFSVFLTTRVEEWKLSDAANVDEIERIEVEELDTSQKMVVATTPVQRQTASVQSTGFYRVDPGTLQWLNLQIDEADSALRRIPVGVGRPVQRLRAVLGEIREVVVSIGVRSFAPLLERLASTARDLSTSLGKQVAVELSGTELRVDARVFDEIHEPLLHVVRNAVDHGIETSAERSAAGKPEHGTIAISAHEIDGTIEVSVRDDGRGLDFGRLKEAASSKGLSFDRDDPISLLATAGFSTAPVTTGLSGRGFGLDIVVQRVRSSGGTVGVESVAGVGSTFIIRVPSQPANIARTVVRHDGALYALPSGSVERTLPFDVQALKRDRAGGIWLDRIPLYSIKGRLHVGDRLRGFSAVLLVRHFDKAGWLCVDEVLFERQGMPPMSGEIERIEPATLLKTIPTETDRS